MNKCLERVNDRHFWNPGVFSYAMIPRCHFNSRVFFYIVTSIVYEGDSFVFCVEEGGGVYKSNLTWEIIQVLIYTSNMYLDL
jgi:hypothetical protein